MRKTNIISATVFDFNQLLKQIKLPSMVYMCALIPELPSYISTLTMTTVRCIFLTQRNLNEFYHEKCTITGDILSKNIFDVLLANTLQTFRVHDPY